MCPLVEVIFFLPPTAVTKAYNLAEPKDMGIGGTNSARDSLDMMVKGAIFTSSP